MLNDASGFSKIVLAVGYTDLRQGIDGLASIVKFNISWIPLKRMSFFFSAAEGRIVSKAFFGKEMDFFSCINALKSERSAGRGLQMKQCR